MEIKKKENNTVFFDIVLKREDINNAETEVYKKNKKQFQLPGFRKGHVPRKMIENMYGKDVFFEDAINELLPAEYEKAIKELDLKVVDQPNIDIDEDSVKDNEDLTIKVSVDVKPEVELKDYEGIEIEDPTLEVTDELIDSEVENQRAMNARIINVDDRAVKDGDTVNIDFKGSVDGKYFEGGEAESQDLKIGSNTFIPGFEEQLIGHEIGEEFDITVKFPEDYHQKDLAGKDAKFEIKLNSISYEELPELDDEFVKDISEFETLEELKEDTKKNLKEDKEKFVKNQIQNEAIKALVEKSEVNAPDPLVNQEIDLEMQNLDQRLRQMGISLQQYIEMTKMDMAAIRDQYRAVAEDKVKANLVMDEVALKENIEVSDEEIENEIKDAAKQYGVDDYEKFKEIFEKNVSRDTVIENVKRRKAVELLEKNVKLVPAKKEEENKEDEKED